LTIICIIHQSDTVSLSVRAWHELKNKLVKQKPELLGYLLTSLKSNSYSKISTLQKNSLSGCQHKILTPTPTLPIKGAISVFFAKILVHSLNNKLPFLTGI